MSKVCYVFFDLLALAVIVFLAVDLSYMAVCTRLTGIEAQPGTTRNPPEIKSRGSFSLAHYKEISERDIFWSRKNAPAEKEEEDIENLKPTELNLALLGTVLGNQGDCFAVIEETGKRKQDLYRTGDEVEGATVRRILRGKVVLKVGDRNEILTIEEAAAPRQEEGPEEIPESASSRDRVTVSRSEVRESIKNIHQLLAQARIRPHFRNGRPEGMLITHIKPGSFFQRLGLRNGDLVQGIDGRAIKGPSDLLRMYNSLRSGSELDLQVKRGNQQRIINYNFR